MKKVLIVEASSAKTLNAKINSELEKLGPKWEAIKATSVVSWTPAEAVNGQDEMRRTITTTLIVEKR